MERNPDTWYRRTNPVKHRQSLTQLGEFIGANPKNMVFVENVTSGSQVVTYVYVSPSLTSRLVHETYINLPDDGFR